MITKRLEYFKKYFETLENRKSDKWRVFYLDDFEDEKIMANTIYFVITGEEERSKQKSIDFSIFYVITKGKRELIYFREEIKSFIKLLGQEFETNNFFCINNSYKISYSTDDKGTLRIAEIQCSYDCTREVLDDEYFEEKIMLMDKLAVKYVLNE